MSPPMADYHCFISAVIMASDLHILHKNSLLHEDLPTTQEEAALFANAADDFIS